MESIIDLGPFNLPEDCRTGYDFADGIGRKLAKIFDTKCDSKYADINFRGRQSSTYTDPTVLTWHYDFENGDARANWIIIWTNLCGTEIQLPNGAEVSIPEGRFTLIKNSVCLHRVPNHMTVLEASNRYFIRCIPNVNMTKSKVQRIRAKLRELS